MRTCPALVVAIRPFAKSGNTTTTTTRTSRLGEPGDSSHNGHWKSSGKRENQHRDASCFAGLTAPAQCRCRKVSGPLSPEIPCPRSPQEAICPGLGSARRWRWIPSAIRCSEQTETRCREHACPLQVTGQWNADDRRDSAAIHRIALDDDDRPPEAGTRTTWVWNVCPPNIPLGDHHSLCSKRRLAAAETKSSLAPPTSEQTRSNASVTYSGAWRATYSARARLYTSLRDLRMRSTSCSVASNTRSGMETAVFILLV